MLDLAFALALSVSPGLMHPPSTRPLVMQEVELTFAADKTPDWSNFYPKTAQAKAVQGSAEVMCRIGADQKLTDCAPVAETPVGEGFGASAANLFSMMQASPQAADGSATANRQILLHFNFKLNN